jgi:hypothetical protein
MKTHYRSLIVGIFFVSCFSAATLADPPGPPPPPGGSHGGGGNVTVGAPIDDGNWTLLFLGLAFGVFSLYSAKKETTNKLPVQ